MATIQCSSGTNFHQLPQAKHLITPYHGRYRKLTKCQTKVSTAVSDVRASQGTLDNMNEDKFWNTCSSGYLISGTGLKGPQQGQPCQHKSHVIWRSWRTQICYENRAHWGSDPVGKLEVFSRLGRFEERTLSLPSRCSTFYTIRLVNRSIRLGL